MIKELSLLKTDFSIMYCPPILSVSSTKNNLRARCYFNQYAMQDAWYTGEYRDIIGTYYPLEGEKE